MKSTSRYLLVLAVAAVAIAAKCNDSPTQPEPPTAQCGTIQGIACPVGQTCELPAGQCQTADLGGLCVLTPDFCTEEYTPVCGCDGVTYSNDCTRLMAGVQKSHDGECT